MRIFVDLDAEKAVLAPGVSQLIGPLQFKRATLAVLEVQFTRGITVIELPVDAEGKFEIKTVGDYDAPPLTGAAAWTKTGSGTSTVYSFSFALINTGLDAAFGINEPAPFTATAATDLLNATAHGLIAGDKVQFGSDDTLPGGLQAGTDYFVIAAGLTADAFRVSTTLAGTQVDITSAGTGTHEFAKISNDVVSLTFMAEVSWTYAGSNHKTQTLDVEVANDVNRDDDVIPDSPAIIYTRGNLRFGTTVPDNGVGLDGDAYLRTTNNDLYVRDGGTYSVVANLTGGPGTDGTDGGFGYLFNSATSGNPGSGKFLFNNATFASATSLLISETDNDSNAIGALLATLDDTASENKCLVVARKVASNAFFAFYITAALTDNGAYDTFPITPVASAGSIANDDEFVVAFYPVSDKGTDAGFGYLFNSATSGDPGSGKFLFNNATFASATQCLISETDQDANGLSALLAVIDDSTSTNKCLVVARKENTNAFFSFFITAALTDNGAYDTFPITPIAKVGSIANNDSFRVSFFIIADKGTTGTAGPGYLATSATSFAIATGSKAFTTQAGLAYSAGARVRVTSRANTANWMEGVASAYSGTTLTVTIDKFNGIGTHTDWDINLTGEPGVDGTDGDNGVLILGSASTHTYASDGDSNGVFYMLGTNFGSIAWENPFTAGRLGITASSDGGGGPLSGMVDRATSAIFTDDIADSYFVFDLGAGRSLELSSWLYRSRSDQPTQSTPTELTLEGSNDGSSWTSIDVQSGISISSASSWRHYTASSSAYRYFRLRQTAANASATNYLTIGEFELYGDFTYGTPIEGGEMVLFGSETTLKPATDDASTPVDDATVVGYLKITVDGADAWIPYYQ